jgi:hypothetical protein
MTWDSNESVENAFVLNASTADLVFDHVKSLLQPWIVLGRHVLIPVLLG